MPEPLDEFAFPEKFPTNEADIVRLAQKLSALFKAHPDIFPSPPVPPDQLDQSISAYHNALENMVVALSRRERAVARKNAILDELVEMLESERRKSAGDDEGGEARPRLNASAAEAPGQVGFLEVVQEGPGTVSLAWQEPREGGEVLLYWIMRRQVDGDASWQPAAPSIVPEITLIGQEPGVELEYHVIAVNKVGEGPESNSVRARPQ